MIIWITENVAIGEYHDACSRELIEKEKIDCVLSLRILDDLGEPLMLMQNGVAYFKIPVGRHQGIEPIKIELRTAAYMLEELTDKYSRILVHCTAGIDRSPFVVAYWLANKEYYTLHNTKDQMIEAYKDIKKKRPQIIKHYEWI